MNTRDEEIVTTGKPADLERAEQGQEVLNLIEPADFGDIAATGQGIADTCGGLVPVGTG